MDIIQSRILIIGAGPGGATAALFLAKAGIECVVVDKAKFPRDKVCGDAWSGKVGEVLRKLDPEIVERFAKEKFEVGSWGVTFTAPNKKSLRVPFRREIHMGETAPGFIAKRIDSDNFLVEEMRKHSSIKIIEECSLEKFERTENGWDIYSADGKFHFQPRLVIDASGAHSRFAKQVGGIEVEPKHYCAGIRAYYKNVAGMDHQNFIELIFLKEFLPGYFWIFPLPNGEANVGVGMRSDRVSAKKIDLKKEMLRMIAEHPLLKERFANAIPDGPIRGYGLPLGSKKRRISGDGFMLVGDAASLIDPFTGEGIGNAMMSGMVASRVAEPLLNPPCGGGLELPSFSAEKLLQYDEQVYHRLWSELKLSHRMQQMVNFPWLFNLVVNKANRSKTLREMIMSMFEDMDVRAQLRNPAFYFRLLFTNK